MALIKCDKALRLENSVFLQFIKILFYFRFHPSTYPCTPHGVENENSPAKSPRSNRYVRRRYCSANKATES